MNANCGDLQVRFCDREASQLLSQQDQQRHHGRFDASSVVSEDCENVTPQKLRAARDKMGNVKTLLGRPQGAQHEDMNERTAEQLPQHLDSIDLATVFFAVEE